MGQAKLEKALKRGGIAERKTGQGYLVWRCRNRKRRALGVMEMASGDALRAEGTLRLIQGEAVVYEWAGAGMEDAPHLPPPIVLMDRSARKPKRDLLTRALHEASDVRDRERLADAAGQFVADFETAAQPHKLTMNWSRLALGKIDGGAQRRSNLPSRRSAEACQRLETLSISLDEKAWQLLQWALVRELSCREVSRRLGVSPAATSARLAAALRDVAHIYDQKVRRRQR